MAYKANKNSKSQNERVLNHLQKHGKITPLQALKRFGCLRLGARIFELRSEGHDIVTSLFRTKHGANVARYSLA